MEARKKVARLVLSFVVVFVVCWLPRHVWYFWFNFDPNEYNLFWHVFKITAFCLSYINSCVNPLALYFLSRQFRRYYDRYLFCGCRRQLQAGDQRGPALLATSAQRSQRAAPADSMATSRVSMATSRPHERMRMTVVNVDAKQHAAIREDDQRASTPRARTQMTSITLANTEC